METHRSLLLIDMLGMDLLIQVDTNISGIQVNVIVKEV